jgi:hypothetical protein
MITATPPKLEHLDLSFPAKNKGRKRKNTNINHHSLTRLGEQKLYSSKGWERKQNTLVQED